MYINIMSYLEFLGKVKCHKSGQRREQGCQKDTDITDVDRDVKEVHKMVDDGRCHHQTYWKQRHSIHQKKNVHYYM
jgi:hypothetical protein